MQRGRAWAAAIAAAGLVACGRGSGETKVAVSPPPGDGGGAPPEKCTDVTIRLLGVAQSDVSKAHLVVSGVTATLASGGALALAGVPAGSTVDLSTDLQAAALGSFRLADATGPLTVALSFSGGDAARWAFAGPLDTCGAPITFRMDPGQVDASRCQAIVKLDVSRSIVADRGPGAFSFLPQFGVAF